MRQRLKKIVYGMLFCIFSSCASNTVQKLGPIQLGDAPISKEGYSFHSEVLPKEVSKEARERFTVTEFNQLEPVINSGNQTKELKTEKRQTTNNVFAPNKRWGGVTGARLASGKINKQAPFLKDYSNSALPEDNLNLFDSREREVLHLNRNAIWIGEKLHYDISYFGMKAGEFKLEALPFKSIDKRKVYHIRGEAKSSSVFGTFYRLRDIVETFIDYEGVFSHRFHIQLDESKQTRNALELYDSIKQQTFYWNRWNRKNAGYTESKDYFPIQSFPQDSLSSLLFIRTQSFELGKEFEFPLVSEGKVWKVRVSVIKKEKVPTVFGKVDTWVLKPVMISPEGIPKKGDTLIWIANHPRRWIVKIEAKVKVGTIVAQLKEFNLGQKPI